MTKPAPRLLAGMPYTPSWRTNPDYLRARMQEWRRQIEAEKKQPIPIRKEK